jgi:hypothetical protein
MTIKEIIEIKQEVEDFAKQVDERIDSKNCYIKLGLMYMKVNDVFIDYDTEGSEFVVFNGLTIDDSCIIQDEEYTIDLDEVKYKLRDFKFITREEFNNKLIEVANNL